MREKPLILLVDDDPDFLEIVSLKLRSSGFDAEVAHNAVESLRRTEELQPDLILMDIHMPGSTGTDAALAVKQNPKTKDIHIAFLSSLNDPWPAMKGEKDRISGELGMDAFLSKTDDLNDLVRQIREILAKIKGAA